ncbi:C25 family cysteine peptidase [Calditrichota bacterium]
MEGRDCQTFIIPGEGLIWEFGKPTLPSVSRFIVVPPDAGLRFTYEEGESEIIQADQPPSICTEESLQPFIRDSDGWRDDIYPAVPAEMSEPINLRGVRLVKVTTYPVRYNAKDNTYVINDQIKTNIEYTDDEPINPVEHPVRKYRSPQFKKMIRALAVNGDIVGRDDPDWGDPNPYMGHYVVVMHENSMEYVAPFIEWRRKSGWKVDIILETSENSIKNALEDLYEEALDDGIDPFDHILIVGDFTGYSSGSGSPGWQVASPVGSSRWSSPSHGDYKYACLEGNDDRPDVAISRWIAGSRDMIELFWGRTKAYEMEPYMEDTDWFTRGGVFSQHWGNSESSAWHLTIHTNVRWAAEMLEHLGYDEVRQHERYQWDQQGSYMGPFEEDLFNDGANVHLGRAENYYWRSSFQGVDENVTFPIRLVTSGHGEWTAWNIMRSQSAGGDNLKGAVATTCGWGGPDTFDMSLIWLGLVRSVMLLDMPFGWGRIFALTQPELFVPSWYGSHSYIRTDFDAYGDPGVQPWNGVPRMVEAEATETITPQTRIIDVLVYDPDTDDPVPNAQVTLYIPGGDMPDFDDEDYSTYDEMSMVTRISDSEGRVVFSIPEGADLGRGDEVFVTITGRSREEGDIRPFFIEWEVETPDLNIEISGYSLVDEDDDDEINPGDVLTLSLIAANNGTRTDAEEVFAVVSSLSSYLEFETDTIYFGDIDAGGEEEGDETVEIIVAGYCPDGRARPATRPIVQVEFISGDQSWRTGIELDPYAPHFDVTEINDGDIIVPGEENTLKVTVKNTGRLNAEDVTGILESHGIGVSVAVRQTNFPDISVTREGTARGNGWTVAGNTLASPGLQFPLLLRMLANDGFEDTTSFIVQVGEPGENTPQGPDAYGYVCYDDTDDDWGDFAPEYDWIEISTDENYDYRGVRMDFEGDSDLDVGETFLIDFEEDEFVTQFYGNKYNDVSVSTNGFICLGDQAGGDNESTEDGITNFQNWPLDQAMGGGAGMIAPYWDWLKFNDNSGVFYYYSQDDHMLIIEWYMLSHKSGGDNDLTFQAILYDERYWRSATGDPKILFQYKNIGHTSGTGTAWNTATPYASVGISSPDGDAGISYFWNNQYPETSAPVADRRAILFATSVQNFLSGYLSGYVTDYETGAPIEGARVITDYGFLASTDSTGFWFIAEALAEKPYNITARQVGYNDSTFYDLELENEDSVQVDFALLHPEFTPSSLQLGVDIDPDLETEIEFSIENTGNGPLNWRMERHLPRDADVDPWVHRENLMASDSTGNEQLGGVVFADGKFFVSGDDPEHRGTNHQIYVLSKDGDYERQFSQPNPDNAYNGIKDLAWDKRNGILWGGNNNTIFAMNVDGEVINSFEVDLGSNYARIQALTWDETNEVLYVAALISDIFIYSADGEYLGDIDRKGISLYGLTYWTDCPDEYKLFIMSELNSSQQVIYRMDPEEGDTLMEVELVHPEGEGIDVGGISATNQFDVYSWVLLHLSPDGSHDRIDIWQLDARRDWFKLYYPEDYEAESGLINAGETQDFNLVLSSLDLPEETLFEGMLEFYHNDADQETIIDIDLMVIGERPPEPFTLLEPADQDTANPYLLDSLTFVWEKTFDQNLEDIPTYELFFLVGEEEFSIDIRTKTSHTVILEEVADSLGLQLDHEIPIQWWVVATSGEDKVESTDRFELRIIPNALNENPAEVVEFGLQSIYPSPFNSVTSITFGIDKPEFTKLVIYDLTGREMTQLYQGTPKVGYHKLVWNAGSVPSGLYLVKLISGERVENSKVMLIK